MQLKHDMSCHLLNVYDNINLSVNSLEVNNNEYIAVHELN